MRMTTKKPIELPDREGKWVEAGFVTPVGIQDSTVSILGVWPGAENLAIYRRAKPEELNLMPEILLGDCVRVHPDGPGYIVISPLNVLGKCTVAWQGGYVSELASSLIASIQRNGTLIWSKES